MTQGARVLVDLGDEGMKEGTYGRPHWRVPNYSVIVFDDGSERLVHDEDIYKATVMGR